MNQEKITYRVKQYRADHDHTESLCRELKVYKKMYEI